MATVSSVQGYLNFCVSQDVENDTSTAAMGSAFVQIERVGEVGGSIEFPIPAATAAGLVNGPCTVTITQP